MERRGKTGEKKGEKGGEVTDGDDQRGNTAVEEKNEASSGLPSRTLHN